MKTYIIGEGSKEDFAKELKEKLGVDSLISQPPLEIAELNSILYVRSIADREEYFTSLSQVTPYPESLKIISPKDGNILCKCGNKSFNIFYGPLKCVVHCIKCGATFSLFI